MHLLVTNDYPPKHGGIQSYLWELWRRMPPGEAVVMTGRGSGAAATESFDEGEPYRIVRAPEAVLLPTPSLARRVRELADEIDASLVLLDPALPLGLIGPDLGRPYAIVLHGAEVTVPGRLPGARSLLARVLAGASLLVAAGSYPERQALRVLGARTDHEERGPRSLVVPPGVDTHRFRPFPAAERADARAHLGLPARGPLLVSVSRLVPRKGMDTLIEASVILRRTRPELTVAIGGAGRDEARLRRIVERYRAPVRLLGRVPDADLPALHACGDLSVMLCRDRWGGLEQEGFGIVFMEAAAAGVAQVAGDSGGASDAVQHGLTGLVVAEPSDPFVAADAIGTLLDDVGLRNAMGEAARRRAVAEFDYDILAGRLVAGIREAASAAVGAEVGMARA